MDNTMMVALQTQRVLQRRMDIAAHNLANMATTGFKADALLMETVSRSPAASQDRPQDIRFVRDMGLARDMRQGPVRMTGGTFDLALQGEGFFTVQGQDGPLYTRDGAFTLDGAGQLVTREGRAVLNEGGAPIVLDPRGEPPVIGRDGAVRVAGVEAGRIGVVSFARPGALERTGENLWTAAGQQSEAFTGEVVQGAIEDSNVVPVLELTSLIQISRAYESAARVVRSADELRQRTIDRLGRS
jgi:flagellar basal-body rod protein FlgF